MRKYLASSTERIKLVRAYRASSLANFSKTSKESSDVFETIVERRDLAFYTVAMAACAREWRSEDALDLFHAMLAEGLHFDALGLVVSLNSRCVARPGNLSMVERIHSWILENDRKLSAATGTALLKMYLKCGSVERAEKVFQEMTHRNVKTWTILIAALGERGSIEEAMVAFRAMQLDGIQPNSFTLVAIFQACATRLESREDDRVKALCNQAVESGLLASSSWNVIVATAVIGTYGKCGSVDKALEVFERTPRESRDVVAWNSIITVFVEQNKPELALKLFQEMQLEGEEPTRITLLKVLAAATASRDLGVGRLIHREARFRSMDRDLVVGTALASMYSKLGRVEELLEVMERIEQGGRDLVCWNMIISALVQHSRSKEALAYFREMNLQGVKPDRVTLAPLISSATFPENESKVILCEISRSGLSSNAGISNAILNFHAKGRRLEEARRVFDGIQERDLVSWNSMISAYAAEGFAREAVILFHRMKQEGFQPSSVTSTVIFAAFSELHGLEEACRVVTVEENLEPASLWSLLISTCAQQGRSKQALEIFRAMQLQGMRVDRETLVPVIVSCGACSALREGRLIHQELQRSAPTILEEDTRLKNAMIDMYGRSGKLLDVAHQIFTEIKQPSVISWTAIVAAYAQNGRVEEATLLFHLMKLDGSSPDTLTFTTILSMYSHAGLLEDGCHCFGSISRDHFLVPAPQHYNCVIDLLGRAGRIEDAEGFVRGMPCATSAPAWTALLSACKTQGDVDRGKRIADGVAECSTAYIGLISTEEP